MQVRAVENANRPERLYNQLRVLINDGANNIELDQ